MRNSIVLLLSLVLLSCNTLPEQKKQPEQTPAQQVPQADQPQTNATPTKKHTSASALNGEVLYELLSAEFAGRRGKLDFALDHYLRAAERLNSAYIAQRAVAIAQYRGDNNATEKALKRWLELAPENFEAHKTLFSLYLKQNRQKQASDAAQALYRANKNKSFALQVISGLLLKQKQSTITLAVLEDLLQAHPNNKDLLFVKAKKLFDGKQLKPALAVINRVLEIAPDYIDAYIVKAEILQKSGKKGMIALLQKAITQHPRQIKLRLAIIRYLTEQKQFKQTRAHLEQAAMLAKNNADLIFAVGLIAIDARQYDQAEQYLKRALKLGAHNNISNYYLGRVAAQRQQWQQAIDHYSLVRDGIHRLDAQLRIVEIYAKLNNIREAQLRLHLLRANYPKTDPRNVEFILYEADLLRSAGRFQDSWKVLDEGVKQFPDNVDLLYSRALSADKIGRPRAFERDLRIILGKEPQNAQALNALGYYLVSQTERLDEAERLLTQAIKLEPDDAAIIDSIGWLKYKKGDIAGAFKWLKKAYDKLFDPEISAHMGELYWQKGERKRAKQIWYKALKSFPNDRELRNTLKRYQLPLTLPSQEQ